MQIRAMGAITFVLMTWGFYLLFTHVDAQFIHDVAVVSGVSPTIRHLAELTISGP
ncbi:hypothetical protein [Ferroacidibacillus organovorans]|uniref:hypothetical protein n=1 Tax=Ferroacidibacillus organovorans TaxID=1765683 RepID=UPI0012E6F55A|nr:hypothetical protein [Ferroacidibacillus organovorans]